MYCCGHRNGFGLAFDPVSGNLWDSENGDDAFDEINKVVPGGNYGWTQVMGPLGRIAQFKTIETNLFTPAAALIGAIQQLRFPVTRVAYTPAVVTPACSCCLAPRTRIRSLAGVTRCRHPAWGSSTAMDWAPVTTERSGAGWPRPTTLRPAPRAPLPAVR
ncbi:MAG: PQQ-dependent sugar dehydrogenase [Betaproteobacteria bacterium]|nr:PQQ-dependent sugar dehydrogenase [Betaproteobacteria bacterium]